MKKTGDCYEAAAKIIIAHLSPLAPNPLGERKLSKPILVHAEVSGQGPLEGVRYGHAWVENGQTVFDYSNGGSLRMPKSLYYRIGEDQIVEPKYYTYTPEEARRMLLRFKTYGPWELETETGL